MQQSLLVAATVGELPVQQGIARAPSPPVIDASHAPNCSNSSESCAASTDMNVPLPQRAKVERGANGTARTERNRSRSARTEPRAKVERGANWNEPKPETVREG